MSANRIDREHRHGGILKVMNRLTTAICTTVLGLSMAGLFGSVAVADQNNNTGYWQDGQWRPFDYSGYYNIKRGGQPTTMDYRTQFGQLHYPDQIHGIITTVWGGYLLVRRSDTGDMVRVNDWPALRNKTSGHVYTGRAVTAHGYWENGVFVTDWMT